MSTMPAGPVRTRLLLLCRGALDWSRAAGGDPPLTPDAVRDAELAAATFPHFDVIVASPQQSGQDTAEAVLAQRPVAMVWRDTLDEIRSAPLLESPEAYALWLDRLFETYDISDQGESLADGAGRLTAALRAVADQYHGRSALIVSHPVILLAFRSSLLQTAVERHQVDMLPTPALAVVDYVEGRFYLVQDFPTRYPT